MFPTVRTQDAKTALTAVMERIPESKRMTEKEERHMRWLDHTLFSDESGEPIRTPWTPFQRCILECVCHEGLMDFTDRYPRQVMLLKWALEMSLVTGDPRDILVPEMVRVRSPISRKSERD